MFYACGCGGHSECSTICESQLCTQATVFIRVAEMKKCMLQVGERLIEERRDAEERESGRWMNR